MFVLLSAINGGCNRNEGRLIKWFKHYADASDDEFVAELEEIFGLAGYARWFKMLEIIAKQMDKSDRCSVSYSWVKWQALLKGKRNKLETFLVHCENKLKINLKQTENILEIKCSNLLKIRDNHTKNLQVTNKQLTSQELKELKELKDKEKDGAEPQEASTPPAPVFLAIPLKGDSEHLILESTVLEWEAAWPGLDVRKCLRSCKQWNKANSLRRKTAKGISKHVVSWLERDHNAGKCRKSNDKEKVLTAADYLEE